MKLRPDGVQEVTSEGLMVRTYMFSCLTKLEKLLCLKNRGRISLAKSS